MSSNVISDVSSTLQDALTAGLRTLEPAPPPVAMVSDLLDNIPLSPATLTLFLFEVVEDGSARNRPPIRQVIGSDVVLKRPPMTLLLRYMLTPWSHDRATDQKILARAMQVLYEEPILAGPQLRGDLSGKADSLKTTMAPITLEERTRIWYALQRPYRLSITYEVRVVNLISEQEDVISGVTNRTLSMQAPPQGETR